MHAMPVKQGTDPIHQVRCIAREDWRGCYYMDENTQIPAIIDALFWYMAPEEYEAFVPHDNTPEGPYFSDCDFGMRRVPNEIATPMANNGYKTMELGELVWGTMTTLPY